MTSVQERPQINRTPADKWTTREQLCLVSAVCRSGEQNWMNVSRSLKHVCGSSNRPADWFSQKSCSVQYTYLLEDVDPDNRKSSSGMESPVSNEKPADLILSRLNEERMQELKADICKDQEEYAKIYGELKAMQAGQLSEEQLMDMWRDIEKQQEAERIEEMKLENQLREREQLNQEMQRSWPNLETTTIVQKSANDTTPMDMDVEEIIGTGKVMIFNLGGTPTKPQQPTQTATSPLLSSLLKTPTASGVVAPNPPVATSSSSTPNSARATAPTITTLLTSGSIPNSNQPAITLKSSIPPNEAVHLLTRPISGPPVDSLCTSSSSAQNLISPSQSAPTLSMLLEKNKGSVASYKDSKANEGSAPSQVDEVSARDSNNEEVPMDIDEEVGGTTIDSNINMTVADSDDPDPNEEQQLLEVFKNIGNIDELDIDVAAVIDEEVDFLKGVDEESPNNSTDVMDFEMKRRTEGVEMIPQMPALEETKNNKAEKFDCTQDGKFDLKTDKNSDSLVQKELKKEASSSRKIETVSSDDSNDNIPLAEVASLESKERNLINENTPENCFLKEVESALKNEDSDLRSTNEIANEIVQVEGNKEDKLNPSESSGDLLSVGAATSEETKDSNDVQKSPPESDGSDIIIIPTDDDESNVDLLSQQTDKREKDSEEEEDHEETTKSPEEEDNNATVESESITAEQITEESQKTPDTESERNAPPTTTISIVDTDEDSSTTDISIITGKEDKTSSSPHQSVKNSTDSTHEDLKTEDDSIIMSLTTPARPPVLRKLRDRDRSESPMIDDETTNASDHSMTQRSRRRYSSTPVIDSIPNSPASSDREDRDIRVSKKSLMSIYNSLLHNKNATIIQRAFYEDHTPKYDEVCLRPMDLLTIKKNIDSGSVRSINELQRDVLLMCHNTLMLFSINSPNYRAARAFLQECQTLREFVSSNESTTKAEKDVKEGKSSNTSGVKIRGSARKSQRMT